MDLIELSKYLLDEQAAEEYLLEKGVIKTFTKCIRCESEKLGKIRRGKIKCYDCKYEWKQTKGSILEQCRISASKFLGLLKLFELEIPAYKVAKLINLNEKVVETCFLSIRNIISDEYEIINRSKVQRFSINEINGQVIVNCINENDIQDWLEIKRIRDLVGDIQFELKFRKQKFYIVEKRNKNELTNIHRFLRHLNYRIGRMRNLHFKYIYGYIKEIEFRFNNRNESLFISLIQRLKAS